MYSNFFTFCVMVLELFECHRGYLCITVNINFFRFASLVIIPYKWYYVLFLYLTHWLSLDIQSNVKLWYNHNYYLYLSFFCLPLFLYLFYTSLFFYISLFYASLFLCLSFLYLSFPSMGSSPLFCSFLHRRTLFAENDMGNEKTISTCVNWQSDALVKNYSDNDKVCCKIAGYHCQNTRRKPPIYENRDV